MKTEEDQISPQKGRCPGLAERSPGHHRRWALACLAAAFFLAGAAQSGQQTPDPIAHPPNPVAQPDGSSAPTKSTGEVAPPAGGSAAGAQHDRQIADDSARLLKLATDLKTEVDKTNRNTLSLRVIRTADEIEHLAHNVHEKMKLTVAEK